MGDSATGFAPVAHHERHGPLTVYITASDAALLSLTTICTSSRIYVLLCLLAQKREPNEYR